MWTTRAAALTALLALVSQNALAEPILDKRCRACPLIVPECHGCPDGQTCTITPNTCTTCPQALCVAAGSNPFTGGAPLITTGFSIFPTAPLPPGVTPTTVSPNEQTGPNTNAPAETGNAGSGSGGTSSNNGQSQTTTTTAAAGTVTQSANSTSSSSSSSSSAASSQAANQASSASSAGGAAVMHAAVPWAVEVGAAAVLGLLAL